MATRTTTLFSLFLSLALVSFFIGITNGATLNFQNRLRPDPEDSIIISCGSFKQVLGPGQTSSGLAVSSEQKCKAVWWTDYANFKGYTQGRDGGNTNLYWKMDEGGVSLSYDNSNFVKIAGWKSE